MHEVPTLPYRYSDLEPHIDEETMRLHHLNHHQAYVDKLNSALENYHDLASKPLLELVAHLEAVPETIRLAVRNHGGGHWNHSFLWESMSPPQSENNPADGAILAEIEDVFGDLDKFKEAFIGKALSVFGSGWGWLVLGPGSTGLEIVTTANQDSPVFDKRTPLLGVDVWEHAYYLKYQNRRAKYLEAFFNVINWKKISARLQAGPLSFGEEY